MTINEAKDVLTRLQNPEPWEEQITHDAYDALEIAKKAIEQPQIIRCKDCKWHDNPDESPRWIPCLKIRTKDDWFCADGEPRI